MKESSLIALVKLRQELFEKELKSKEPLLSSRDQEILDLKKFSQSLQEKLKSNEDIFTKNLTAMRHEIESRDAEILKLNKKKHSQSVSLQKCQSELEKLQNLLSESRAHQESLQKLHEQELSDLRLKHDQEIYILKKMKKT